MGNAAVRAFSTSLDTISLLRNYLLEYSTRMIYIELLGDGKFLKSIRGKYDKEQVVVKMYRLYTSNENLNPARMAIEDVYDKMKSKPNVLPYAKWFVSSKSKVAYLVRPYVMYNVYDRCNTRPFLTFIEKKWYAFQILIALEQMHSIGLCHGDIKPENVMVTAWNWIMLTDLAPFKPTYLPDDDPSEYYYYYCAMDTSRRCCNIAPERFYSTSSRSIMDEDSFLGNLEDSNVANDKQSKGKPYRKDGVVKPSMDIFSAGCVIGEIFLGGKAIFDLPSLLRYRSGVDKEAPSVENIQYPLVKQLVEHMIQRDPTKRFSANEYRTQCTTESTDVLKIFPRYFDSFLYPLMRSMLTNAGEHPDQRIRLVCKFYGDILTHMANDASDPTGVRYFKQFLEPKPRDRASSNIDFGAGLVDASALDHEWRGIKTSTENLTLNENDKPPCTTNIHPGHNQDDTTKNIFATKLSIQEFVADTNGISIIIRFVCATLRHVTCPSLKVAGLHLLARFSLFTDDETKLEQIVPNILEAVGDNSAVVRANSIRSLSYVVANITSLSLIDARIFPQYIFPAIMKFPLDPDEMVKISFAEFLPSLAETSKRFLEISFSLRKHASDQTDKKKDNRKRSSVTGELFFENSNNYHRELQTLQDIVAKLVIQIATPDQSSSLSQAKRALLSDISKLCVFFGRDKTLDIVLPQLIAVLNDRDAELRSSFFKHIPGIGAFVGRKALQMYILPCIEQALVDVEEAVIVCAVKSLGTLCELGLFESETIIENVKKVAPLLFHPSDGIRDSVVEFICKSSQHLGIVDTYVFLRPVLQPYVQNGTLGKHINRDTLLTLLKPKISRKTFDAALIVDNENASLADSSQEEDGKLSIMEGYVQIASMHMRSKMALAEAEQAKRLHESSSSNSSSTFILRHSLYHCFRVPLMQFALLHAPPIPLPDDEGQATNEIKLHHLVRLYGLQALSSGTNEAAKHKNATEEALSASSTLGIVKVDHSVDPALVDNNKVLKRLQSLDIPPLPLPMGALQLEDGKVFSLANLPNGIHGGLGSSYSINGNSGGKSNDGRSTLDSRSLLSVLPKEAKYRGWKPNENVLVADLNEHGGAVNKMAVAQDFSFFASGSNDGTVKIWSTKELIKSVSPSSLHTINPKSGRIVDLAMCENSHSIVLGSSEGEVSVHRVDGNLSISQLSSSGDSYIKKLSSFSCGQENAVVTVNHLNEQVGNIVTYALQNGNIFGYNFYIHFAHQCLY